MFIFENLTTDIFENKKISVLQNMLYQRENKFIITYILLHEQPRRLRNFRIIITFNSG